ncbi:hypothetical protein BDR07DRAFT_1489584 [Suillus spraguei]|nr:hypothetical protein BDR07DRAFT_1489584 [Suillus spraguei]
MASPRKSPMYPLLSLLPLIVLGALGLTSPPKFPQQLPQPPVGDHYMQHGTSHMDTHTSQLASPPLHMNSPTLPQNSYMQELLDEEPTPKQGSSNSFMECMPVASPSTETYPLPSHDLHSENRAYMSDDMPWDNSESLQTEAIEMISSSFHVWSPSHSRDGFNGSNAPSLRSPVNRVSSPLRNTFNSSEQDAYPGSPHLASAYEPSQYAAPNRVTSPSPVHSFASHAESIKSTCNSTAPTAVNNHEPRLDTTYERTSSPVFHHLHQASPSPDPYALTKNAVTLAQSEYHDRSGSNGSLHSTASMPMGIPSLCEVNGLVPKPRPGEPSSYGAVSAYSQELLTSPAVCPPYAPSPSLLGSNDPLGWTFTRAPVISFGFGGKMIMCFHSSSDLMTGYDVALSSHHSTHVHVHVLHTLLPEFALEPSAATYPGPLFSDPGTPVSIMRTGVSSQVKTKEACCKDTI